MSSPSIQNRCGIQQRRHWSAPSGMRLIMMRLQYID